MNTLILFYCIFSQYAHLIAQDIFENETYFFEFLLAYLFDRIGRFEHIDDSCDYCY
jgi:hypothetical protein